MFISTQYKNSSHMLKRSLDNTTNNKLKSMNSISSSLTILPTIKSPRNKFISLGSKDTIEEAITNNDHTIKASASDYFKPASPKYDPTKAKKSIDSITTDIKHETNNLNNQAKTIASHEDDKVDSNKRVQLWEILTDLKLAAEKYNKNNDIIIPYKQDLTKVLQSLSFLASINSPFYDHMKFVLKILNMAIYFNSKISKNYEDFIQSSKNPDIRLLASADNDSKIPYYSVFLALINEAIREKELHQNTSNEYKTTIKVMQDKSDEQEHMIKQLGEKINDLERNDLKEIYINEIEELKFENQKLNDELKKLRANLTESTQANKELNNTISKHAKVITEKNMMIDCLIHDKITLKHKLDETKTKYNQLKENSHNMKDIIDKLIIKISCIKNEIVNLKKENEIMKVQNEKLSTRAAVGFENLTPRPDYQSLFKEKNIEIFNESPNSKSKRDKDTSTASTVQIFETLLGKYIEIKTKFENLENDSKGSTPLKDRQNTSSISKATYQHKGTSEFFNFDITEKKKIIKSNFALSKITNSTLKEDLDNRTSLASIDRQTPHLPEATVLKIPILSPHEKSSFGVGALEKSMTLLTDVIVAKKAMESNQLTEENDL